MDIDNYAPTRRPGPAVKNIIWGALALGIISVILENTYRPTLSVRYTPKKPEK